MHSLSLYPSALSSKTIWEKYLVSFEHRRQRLDTDPKHFGKLIGHRIRLIDRRHTHTINNSSRTGPRNVLSPEITPWNPSHASMHHHTIRSLRSFYTDTD